MILSLVYYSVPGIWLMTGASIVTIKSSSKFVADYVATVLQSEEHTLCAIQGGSGCLWHHLPSCPPAAGEFPDNYTYL